MKKIILSDNEKEINKDGQQHKGFMHERIISNFTKHIE